MTVQCTVSVCASRGNEFFGRNPHAAELAVAAGSMNRGEWAAN